MGIENIRGLDKAIKSAKENTKKKFKIVWYEYFSDMQDYKENANIPITHKHTGYMKGYGEEFECWDFFEARNIKEAKKIVEDDYYAVDFFTVFDKKKNRVFTEEDINLD